MNLIGHLPAIITNQKLEIIKTTEREDFKQHLVRFYWTPLEQTYGYLLEPNKKGKHPAVITVFYEPETAIGWGGKANRDFAYQLTKRGFVTLSLELDRPPKIRLTLSITRLLTTPLCNLFQYLLMRQPMHGKY